MERYIGEQIRKLCQENESAVRNLLDLVGEKVGKEVEALAQQLRSQSEEARLAKGEARSK